MSNMEALTIRPKISISPNPSLVDDNLNIRVMGLKRKQEVTLRARVSERGHRFYGYAHYRANNDGIVHNNMASRGGTYTGTVSWN